MNDNFKQQVARLYDNRSDSYEQGKLGDLHRKISQILVQDAYIQPGQRILDIATGTGLVAIAASSLVGSSGKIIGVDISPGLLKQAEKKLEANNIKNTTFVIGDGEKLEFAAQSFERVFCCCALHWMTDLAADLRLWHSFLVPGGLIGLTVFADTAFITGVTFKKIAQKYGFNFTSNDLIGTREKCYQLIQKNGFKNIRIKTEQFGSYIDLEEIQGSWDWNIKNPLYREILKLDSQTLEKVKREYMEALEGLVTDKGIWNDITTFFCYGTASY